MLQNSLLKVWPFPLWWSRLIVYLSLSDQPCNDLVEAHAARLAFSGGPFTGRIEAVRVLFDPLVTTYSSLAKRFFYMHDPTTGDR